MKIQVHKIENFTDAHRLDVRHVPVIKRGCYFVDDTVSVDGDAPKKFIGIYDYQLLDHKHKSNRKNWIRYIAKTGHKVVSDGIDNGIVDEQAGSDIWLDNG